MSDECPSNLWILSVYLIDLLSSRDLDYVTLTFGALVWTSNGSRKTRRYTLIVDIRGPGNDTEDSVLPFSLFPSSLRYLRRTDTLLRVFHSKLSSNHFQSFHTTQPRELQHPNMHDTFMSDDLP